MAFLESHQELRDHPKTKKASRLLGIGVPQFLGHLHLLWWWAFDYAQDGDLSGYDNDEIADAAMWDGDPAVFVEVLGACGRPGAPGFLEITEPAKNTIKIHLHDWDNFAGKIIEKRKTDAERKRNARLGLHSTHENAVRGTSNGHPQDGAGTVHNRTVHNHINADAEPTPPGYDELDDLFEKFWSAFPERKGRKAGPKETVKAAFAKVPVKEWPLVVEAAGNYARWCEDADEYAIDPIRFFKNSKWREYRKPIEVKQGKNGAAPIRVDLKGPTPPDGYSWVRNDLGEFVPLERGPDGMFPTGTKDIVESKRREDALRLDYIQKRDRKVGASA